MEDRAKRAREITLEAVKVLRQEIEEHLNMPKEVKGGVLSTRDFKLLQEILSKHIAIHAEDMTLEEIRDLSNLYHRLCRN